MTSARAYRGAVPGEEAIAMIATGAGTHFDPRVAAALLRIHERGDLHPDAAPSEIREMLPER